MSPCSKYRLPFEMLAPITSGLWCDSGLHGPLGGSFSRHLLLLRGVEEALHGAKAALHTQQARRRAAPPAGRVLHATTLPLCPDALFTALFYGPSTRPCSLPFFVFSLSVHPFHTSPLSFSAADLPELRSTEFRYPTPAGHAAAAEVTPSGPKTCSGHSTVA